MRCEAVLSACRRFSRVKKAFSVEARPTLPAGRRGYPGAQPRAVAPDAHTLRLTGDDASRRTPTPSARSESRIGAIECGPPADDGIEAHQRRRPSSGIAGALRRICASMRAHGLARPSKRCTFPSLPGIDPTRWPQAFPRATHPSRRFLVPMRAHGCPRLAKGWFLDPVRRCPSGRMSTGLRAHGWILVPACP